MIQHDGPDNGKIDLSDLKIEAHVVQAFLAAFLLEPKEPISASRLLIGALAVEPFASSPAFTKFASLLSKSATQLIPPNFGELKTRLSPDAKQLKSLPVTPGVARSVHIARRFFEHSEVWGRDYIALALLAPEDRSVEELAAQYGDGLERLQDAWFQFVITTGGRRDPKEWTEWWHGADVPLPTERRGPKADQPSAEGQPSAASTVSQGETQQSSLGQGASGEQPAPETTTKGRPLAWVDNDAVAVGPALNGTLPSDSLNVSDQADVFATLLMAPEVEPPIALGLFGDWGVGKSFFMRLMRDRVRAIVGDRSPEGRAASVARVAQIEFNAWHYVDSDLWASLATHIFDGIARELSGGFDGGLAESTRRTLRRCIRSSQRERQEAEAAIVTAQLARTTAVATLAGHRAVREQAAADYDTLRLGRVWRAALKVRPDPANREQKGWPDVPRMKDQAEQMARRLGIADAISDVRELERVQAELRDLLQRGNALRTVFVGWGLLQSAIAVGALVIAILLWPFLSDRLSALIGLAEPRVGRLLASALEGLALVAPVCAWLRYHIRSCSRAVSYLERIREEIGRPRFHLEEPGEQELKLKVEVERLDSEIAAEERKIGEAERRIGEAEAEIQRIDAGGLVYDFISGKVRDSRYLDRLGLISTIRQDLEQLGDLLRDWRAHAPAADAAAPTASAGKDEGKAGDDHASIRAPLDATPIGRIVLYIDDLDRCPPRRVVEVLQAVHLLLAFDLFVVVVAVDARWLERSLNEAYNPFETVTAAVQPELSQHRFSAYNYLEKIFQIPFSLPRMGEDGYRSLVSAMTTPKRRAGETVDTSDAQRPGRASGEARLGGVANDERGERGAGSLASDGMNTQATTGDLSEEARVAERARDESRRRETEEARSRAMSLTEPENQFIAGLFPFIKTPRLAKRLVNVYRLLRVRAAARDEGLTAFVDGMRGDYRAALILLAINVGFPDLAPNLFEALEKAEGPSFSAWLRATGEIALAFETVATEMRHHKGPPVEDNMDAYRKWVREVGRYSFRWQGEGTASAGKVAVDDLRV